MPWYFPWSDSIKKRASRYLLQHYLGQFLKEKLTLEQLSLDIYNGKGTIKELTLDIESLNESLDAIKAPIQVVDGFLGEISVSIPWSSLLSDSATIEISNLEFTIQTKKWPMDADISAGIDSMFDSMTSSIRLAEGCLRDAAAPGDGDIPCASSVSEAELQRPTFDGLEMFAKTIEAVLSRVKISLVDTIIRLEHIPKDSKTGVALEVRIKRIDYYDDEVFSTPSTNQNEPIYVTAATCLKNFSLLKAQLYFDEFSVATNRSLYKSMTKMTDSITEPTQKSMYFTCSTSMYDSTMTDSISRSQPIKIAALKGKQEIKVRIRQNHELPIPKVQINCDFGVLHSHLSPNQIHHIYDMCKALTEQETKRSSTKPMFSKDYEQVEQLLMDESVNIDTDERTYYDFKRDAAPISHNYHHNAAPGRGLLPSLDDDDDEEFYEEDEQLEEEEEVVDVSVIELKLKISFISAIILHEDPFNSPGDLMETSQSGASKLEKISESYFGRIEGLRPVAIGQDLQEVAQQYSSCCRYDHICLIAKPLSMEMSTNHNGLKFDLHFGDLEVNEAVFDRHLVAMATNFSRTITTDQSETFLKPQISQLLSFPLDDIDEMTEADDQFSKMTSSMYVPSSCIRITYANMKLTPDQETSRPSLLIHLRYCRSEVDISIVDRVHELLNPQTSLCKETGGLHWSTPDTEATFNQVFEDGLGINDAVEVVELDVKVVIEKAIIYLRFPIPDLRTNVQCIDKPWWRRSIHPEVAHFHLDDVVLVSRDVLADCGARTLGLTCNQVIGYFQKSAQVAPVQIIKISSDSNPISFDIRTSSVRSNHLVANHRTRATSQFSSDSIELELDASKYPSPFSDHRVMYANEELIIPNDAAEMISYNDYSMNNSLLTFDISLPVIDIQLLDKPLFELLYNRLLNDLLIWQPGAPSPIRTNSQGQSQDRYSHFSNLQSRPKAYHYDSDSDSDETTTSTIYSKVAPDCPKLQNSMCVHIHIGKADLVCCTEGSPNNRELRFNAERASLTISIDIGGDTRLLEMAVCSKLIELWYMNGQGRESITKGKTIYQTNRDLGSDENALSVAMKITNDFKDNIKEFLVSVGIRGSTLNHEMSLPENTWIMKLIEFFTLEDLPISGYCAPMVITELHLHLWACQVDYRPLYLPLRASLLVQSFSITSNIIVDSPVSVLRFVADNAALYISNKCDRPEVDIHKNYVKVVDVGMFELILRTSNGDDKGCPRIDLKASNDTIHIRTCVDSFRALSALITYLARDGDLNEEPTQEPLPPLPKSVSSESLSKVDIERVNLLMTEAMHESTDNNTDSSSTETPTLESEEFYYASETVSAPATLKPEEPKVIDILYDINDIENIRDIDDMTDSRSNLADDNNEEYCMIDETFNHQPNIQKNTAIIRVLCNNEIIIQDNYISIPRGHADQLMAPSHYPKPIYKYTIDDMSLVWHVYGGSDLKEMPLSPDDLYTEIKFVKGAIEIPKNTRLKYKTARDNDVLVQLHLNKLRFQYDIYPEPSAQEEYYPQRSRQAFLIAGVEVRDLLASSSINKLLYQYTSDDFPKQSHSNMICIKSVQQQPDVTRNIKECSIKVSIQPLRLNIDQDTLFFLKSYFTSLAETIDSEFEQSDSITTPPSSLTSNHIQPVMQVCMESDETDNKDDSQVNKERIAHGIYVKFDELSEKENTEEDDDDKSEGDSDNSQGQTENNDSPIFFKNFIFSPDVPIRLDYQGKRVDMKEGTMIGLLVGLGQLNCSQLKLKRIHIRHGILGVDRLFHYIVKEWLEDIIKNQLPSILGGLGPMHSLIQLVKGVCDLIAMPVEQYKKDGRILRGLRRGANSFITCTAMSALDLTNRMVQCIQFIAELTYDMLSPGPSCQSTKRRRRKHRVGGATSRKSLHGGGRHRAIVYPDGICDGITNACNVVTKGVKDTALTFVQVAKEEHEIKGYTGAVGGVLRQIPSAIVQPVILASEATSCVLGGMRNQLLPAQRKEDQDKWKQVNDSQVNYFMDG